MTAAIAAAIRLASSSPGTDPRDCELPGSEYLKEAAWLGNAPTLRHEWGGETRQTIPGAVWMPGLGDGDLSEATEIFFAGLLAEITERKSRPLVFLCVSSECWLSYNAALWAIRAGYTDVIWYRGGSEAWQAAGLDARQARRAW